MKELGMWQGFNGIWWTPDLGWSDDLDFSEDDSQPIDSSSAKPPQNRYLGHYPLYRGFREVPGRQIERLGKVA